jgi:hypothetical protein
VAKWMLTKKNGRFARKNPLVENRVNPNSRLLALPDKSSQSSGLTLIWSPQKRTFLRTQITLLTLQKLFLGLFFSARQVDTRR